MARGLSNLRATTHSAPLHGASATVHGAGVRVARRGAGVKLGSQLRLVRQHLPRATTSAKVDTGAGKMMSKGKGASVSHRSETTADWTKFRMIHGSDFYDTAFPKESCGSSVALFLHSPRA